MGTQSKPTAISVVVNASEFSAQLVRCVESIIAQKGEFDINLHLIYEQSFSQAEAAKAFFDLFEAALPKRLNIFFHSMVDFESKLSTVQCMLEACAADVSEFTLFLQEADWMLSEERLQKHIELLQKNPNISFSFNGLSLYCADKKEYKQLAQNDSIQEGIISSEWLAKWDLVRRISTAVFRTKAIREIKPNEQKVIFDEWYFELIVSNDAGALYLDEVLSATDDIPATETEAQKLARLQETLGHLQAFDQETKKRYRNYLIWSLRRIKEAIGDLSEELDPNFVPRVPADERYDLIIIDDAYPHPRSTDTWRGIEFQAYFDAIEHMAIYGTVQSTPLLGEESRREIYEKFAQEYPHLKKRVIFPYTADYEKIAQAAMLYFVFLQNAYDNLKFVESYQTPFLFELYPGGGFAFHNELSDKKLREVTQSPWFRGVIVSNCVTYNYLIQKGFCTAQQILPIWGCVLNPKSIPADTYTKTYFGPEKPTLDVAFAAFRYSQDGADKGYDVFVEAAKKLHRISNQIHFHVVGNFDADILDVSELGDTIHFHNVQKAEWFDRFYQQVDIFISPNRVSVLSEGAFDGFPTGCGIDAAVRKTVLLVTDALHQNDGQYIDGKELHIIDADAQQIVALVLEYFNCPEKLIEMGTACAAKARKLYSEENQIQPRVNYLTRELRYAIAHREKNDLLCDRVYWKTKSEEAKTIDNVAKAYELQVQITQELEQKAQLLAEEKRRIEQEKNALEQEKNVLEQENKILEQEKQAQIARSSQLDMERKQLLDYLSKHQIKSIAKIALGKFEKDEENGK